MLSFHPHAAQFPTWTLMRSNVVQWFLRTKAALNERTIPIPNLMNCIEEAMFFQRSRMWSFMHTMQTHWFGACLPRSLTLTPLWPWRCVSLQSSAQAKGLRTWLNHNKSRGHRQWFLFYIFDLLKRRLEKSKNTSHLMIQWENNTSPKTTPGYCRCQNFTSRISEDCWKTPLRWARLPKTIHDAWIRVETDGWCSKILVRCWWFLTLYKLKSSRFETDLNGWKPRHPIREAADFFDIKLVNLTDTWSEASFNDLNWPIPRILNKFHKQRCCLKLQMVHVNRFTGQFWFPSDHISSIKHEQTMSQTIKREMLFGA